MPLTPIAIKVYKAIVNQTGTNPPVMTIVHNTLGNILWEYADTGQYQGTLTGAFKTGKTTILTQENANAHMAASAPTENYVSLTQTTNDGTPLNEILDAIILIEVHKDNIFGDIKP